MKKLGLLLAGVYVAAMLGGSSGVQAHSAKSCVKELKTYAASCKFSPTAWILGFCKNKKAQKWCSDKKQHKKIFH